MCSRTSCSCCIITVEDWDLTILQWHSGKVFQQTFGSFGTASVAEGDCNRLVDPVLLGLLRSICSEAQTPGEGGTAG